MNYNNINDDIINIINILENKNILQDNKYNGKNETELLMKRKDISFETFSMIHKNVESQYIRCLNYVEFNLGNDLDKIIYKNIKLFINVNNLEEKYEYMKIIDNIIINNIIYDNENNENN